MRLTDRAIVNLKVKDGKAIKKSDGEGLFVYVSPQGAKSFRMAYRFQGKQKLLSIGLYPTVSLKEAREAVAEAKRQLQNGIDPSQFKQLLKASAMSAKPQEPVTRELPDGPNFIGKATLDPKCFEYVAREWFHKMRLKLEWTERYSTLTIRRLEQHLFPFIGNTIIADLKPADLLKCVQRIENMGQHETAHRVLNLCGKVFRYAIGLGIAENDVSAALADSIPPAKSKNYATITEPRKVGALLRAIDGYHGIFSVRCALQLSPLLFVRPGELRCAEWVEINFADAEWRIPKERMKMRLPHIVPLSRQALEILQALHNHNGTGKFLFPSARFRDRVMSDNTLNAALRQLGYGPESPDSIVGHGFRHMASTLLNEMEKWDGDVIERQLAHVDNNVRGTYNFAQHLQTRRQMMQDWADYLDALRTAM